MATNKKIKKEKQKEEYVRLHQKAHKKIKNHSQKYLTETRKALTTAILAAFGFLMALSWREVVSEWVEGVKQVSALQGSLIEALFVTLISVMGILIVTGFITTNKDK